MANVTAQGPAAALKSATTTIDVSAATAPTSGQVLTATGGTAATWQTPGGGSGPTVLKDFYTDVGNVGAGETDLYSFTTIANQLSAAGQKLTAAFTIIFNSVAKAADIRLYLAGIKIFDSGAVTASGVGDSSDYQILIIRTGTTTARVSVIETGTVAGAGSLQTDLTGLTFSATNILKITGQSTLGADGDIVAKLGTISWVPAGP